MSEPPAGRPGRDRSFGPAVLLGLAGAALTAVAGAREWATSRGDAAGIRVDAGVSGAESAPLVSALALVALAAWGVVLVVRGRLRRVVAAVGLVSALGSLAAVLLAFDRVQDDAVAATVARGATGDTFTTGLSAWYFLAGAGAVLAVAGLAVAVVRAPGWPAMGSRYDAPSVPARADQDEDLWRALDEGRDPTSGGDPERPTS